MKTLALLALAAVIGAFGAGLTPAPATAGSQCLVVNEVYTEASQPGSSFSNAFIELLNRCNVTVSLSGLTANSVYYGGMTPGYQLSSFALSGSLGPGRYYLIGIGAGIGTPLPTPDVWGVGLVAATPSSVYLAVGTPPAPCGGTIVDLVGFTVAGTPTPPLCSETAPEVVVPSPTQSVARSSCTDTDVNSVDFVAVAPTPQNTSSPPAVVPCGGATPPTAVRFGMLTAVRRGAGVLVRWRTESELGTLGFHVYREVNARRMRVNASLIAAKGRGAYSFLDRRAPRGKTLRYWIQEVAADGTRSWYGPVRVNRA